MIVEQDILAKYFVIFIFIVFLSIVCLHSTLPHYMYTHIFVLTFDNYKIYFHYIPSNNYIIFYIVNIIL